MPPDFNHARKLGGEPNFEGYALEMKCLFVSVLVSGRLTSKIAVGRWL